MNDEMEKDLKKLYSVYAGLLVLHRKYYGRVGDRGALEELVQEINGMNAGHGSNFCNSMTEILRKWMTGRMSGMTPDEMKAFCAEAWAWHRKHAQACLGGGEAELKAAMKDWEPIANKYHSNLAQEMLLAAFDELEGRCDAGRKQAG